MDFVELKRFFLFSLIGSLIVSSLVAVVTVLIGEFNDVTVKVLLTLFMVVLHSIISLAFIWDDEKQHTFARLSFFINTLFIIIIVSFITSLFGIWELAPGETIWNLYQTYFIIGFTALHGNLLLKALGKKDSLDMMVYINYLFLIAVALMLQPIIYIENSARVLSEMFFRILGALGIIDGTLSILVIIFYKLHTHNRSK